MRRVEKAGLIAMLAFLGGCCEFCPSQCPDGDGTVDIMILPLPADTMVSCVSVEEKVYCAPGRTTKDLPDEGDFTIDVDGDDYLLDARSPNGAALQTVYVVVGSKYVIGVYEEGVEDLEGVLRLAREAEGNCIMCPNGATLCGHNPRCK